MKKSCQYCYELKRQRGSETTQQQKEWLAALAEQGYRVAVCKGAADAAKAVLELCT